LCKQYARAKQAGTEGKLQHRTTVESVTPSELRKSGFEEGNYRVTIEKERY